VNRRERWVAPADDGGVLIDPPLERVEELLETNQRRFKNAHIELDGKPLNETRRELQDRLATVADASHFAVGPNSKKWPIAPVIAAGHQPELYHPGVWIKNFALAGLARRHGLAPLNFVVDSDTVKSASIPFPVWDSEPSRVTREVIPFDAWRGEELHLQCSVHDSRQFREFTATTRHVWEKWPFRPLLAEFWQEAVRVHDEVMRSSLEDSGEELPPTLMWCFTSARRALESQWGCHNRELFLLTLDRQSFIARVLGDLPTFHALHNECVGAYRSKYRLRSRTHPVPDLAMDGDFLEAPFWWYDAVAGRRHRLFARLRGDRLDLRPGRNGASVTVRRDSPHLWRDLAIGGAHLYTRALTTTMFIRLCVADLFIHGIGGAKYDEVTDDIIRRYFGIEPPEYMVVSGTLHSPFPRFEATPARRRALSALQRNLHWNPQRFADLTDQKFAKLHDEKLQWMSREPQTPAERRDRFRVLQHLTEALRPLVAKQEAESQLALARCDQELAANDILSRRDYPFVLYPEEKLKPFCTQLLNL
jgi:hypothetical protein